MSNKGWPTALARQHKAGIDIEGDSSGGCGAGKALVECHEEVSRGLKAAEESGNGSGPPAMVGYEDIGGAAFGALGRTIVSCVMYIELLGTCALLFILEVQLHPTCAVKETVPVLETELPMTIRSGDVPAAELSL